MSIFAPSSAVPDDTITTVNDDPVENIVDEKKLRLGIIKSLALDVLHSSLEQLSVRLPEIDKVRDLSTIARDMKTVLSEEDNTMGRNLNQVIIYKPIVNDISKYDTLVVVE